MNSVASICFSLLTLSGVVAFSGVQGQEPVTKAPENVTVIESRTVARSGGSITYNLIETPALEGLGNLVSTPTQEQSLATDTNEESVAPDTRRFETIFASATIYADGTTKLSWTRPEGNYTVWSSANFRYFEYLDQIKTEQAVYSLILAVVDSSESQERPAESASDPIQFALLSAPEDPANADVLQGLEDLHAYYAAHIEELKAAHAIHQAAALADEQQKLLQSSLPRNTVVNFFPIRSVEVQAPQTEAEGK